MHKCSVNITKTFYKNKKSHVRYYITFFILSTNFLFLIQDEEARIELEIDDEEDYQYHHFWLSDFCSNLDTAKYHSDNIVESFSFIPEMENEADIKIRIKP